MYWIWLSMALNLVTINFPPTMMMHLFLLWLNFFTLSITDYILFPYIQINCNPRPRHWPNDASGICEYFRWWTVTFATLDKVQLRLLSPKEDEAERYKVRLTYLQRGSPSPTPACLLLHLTAVPTSAHCSRHESQVYNIMHKTAQPSFTLQFVTVGWQFS